MLAQNHGRRAALAASPMPPWLPGRLIAASGLALVLFLLAHLVGVAQLVLDPAGFEALAAWLHASPWLPAAELGLALAALTHVALSLQRVLHAARARGEAGYTQLRSRRPDRLAAFASRTAPLSGSVLLLFLGVHLRQLRWQRPPAGLEAQAVAQALSSPWALTLYLAAAVALALHLLHGSESAHRSLGLLEAANAARLRTGGWLLALLVGGGFALVAGLASAAAGGLLAEAADGLGSLVGLVSLENLGDLGSLMGQVSPMGLVSPIDLVSLQP